MANWNSQINSYAKQIQQMQEMVAICESRPDVFRYAWFYGRGTFPDNHFTYVFTAKDGELSDLGKLYIALPFKNSGTANCNNNYGIHGKSKSGSVASVVSVPSVVND